MPLVRGAKAKAGKEANLKAESAAGKPKKQALAIAAKRKHTRKEKMGEIYG